MACLNYALQDEEIKAQREGMIEKDAMTEAKADGSIDEAEFDGDESIISRLNVKIEGKESEGKGSNHHTQKHQSLPQENSENTQILSQSETVTSNLRPTYARDLPSVSEADISVKESSAMSKQIRDLPGVGEGTYVSLMSSPSSLKSRKRRHSTASQSSVDSVLSQSPGFLSTPQRLPRSPHKQQSVVHKNSRPVVNSPLFSQSGSRSESPKRDSPVRKKKRKSFVMGF